jgi:tetratricopeptide (TPR) repeat protein
VIRAARASAWPAAALAVTMLVPAAARGQQQPPPDSRIQPRPLLVRIQPPATRIPYYSARALPTLSPAQSHRLQAARAQREAGNPDVALRDLRGLALEAPRHPLVLTEIALVHVSREAWRNVETLGRTERAATRDSLLLAPELALALERLGRPREAAQIVVEGWLIESAIAEWAVPTLVRLASADARARDPLRRAVERRPDRLDMVRCAARLEWRAGDGAAASRLLAAADRVASGTPLRWSFAEELLAQGSASDSSGAIAALLDLASDQSRDEVYRLAAARRVWQLSERRAQADWPERLASALLDIPPDRWGEDIGLAVSRGLRRSGKAAESRALMAKLGTGSGEAGSALMVERALDELRDGPPDKALPALALAAKGSSEAAFYYAEALFFSGNADSALAWYQRVAGDVKGDRTGGALERIYLIEDANPKSALPALGRMAWEEWRGESRKALVLADSLYRGLPRDESWAYVALRFAALREATGDGKSALEPLLALAETRPDDRLAPLARQRAGDVYRVWLKEPAKALEQYEECLARYPKAWNAAEVRRVVEILRRENRF